MVQYYAEIIIRNNLGSKIAFSRFLSLYTLNGILPKEGDISRGKIVQPVYFNSGRLLNLKRLRKEIKGLGIRVLESARPDRVTLRYSTPEDIRRLRKELGIDELVKSDI